MKWAVVLVILLMIPSVYGLGIAPARKTVEFSPGGSQELSYRIYNSDRQDFVANIKLSDELEGIATLDSEQIEFGEDDVVKSFILKIDFGDTPPEKREGKITISASPSDSPSASVSAVITISAKLSIQATGGVVAEDQDSSRENKSFTPYIVGGLIGLLLLATLGVVITKGSGPKSPAQAPSSSPPPSSPPPASENSELAAAREIENEIEHLRQMR